MSRPGIFLDTQVPRRALSALEQSLEAHRLGTFLNTVVEPYLKSQAQKRFAQGRDPSGKMWAPLAEKTLEMWGEHDPMVLTGDLEDWIVQGQPRTAPVRDMDGGKMGAEMVMPGNSGGGIREKKLKAAQRGVKPNPIKGWRDVPARPVIGLVVLEGVWITGSLHQWLELEIYKAGGGP